MSERQIIFSGPMVRAILDGKKTQTRWVVKMEKPGVTFDGAFVDPGLGAGAYLKVKAEHGCIHRIRCPYGAIGERLWVREAWRITLKITDIRVQRLQEITEADAVAEGVADRDAFVELWDSSQDKPGRRWADNPWVWAITFERVEQ